MTLERRIAAAFRLDEEGWRRHANPWSVWTRNTVLPLLVLAFWSRVWLGWWSLAAIGVALCWAWFNPRLFRPPATMASWAARSVLGERLWMDRDRRPVPRHHRIVPHVLSAVTAAGALLVVWGVAVLHVWATITGVVVVYLGKLWFLDRMVWLHDEMQAPVRK